MTKTPYNESLDADDQISAEEEVAAHLYEYGVSEEEAADLGRDVVYLVLRRFRPDLFENPDLKAVASLINAAGAASSKLMAEEPDVPSGPTYEVED